MTNTKQEDSLSTQTNTEKVTKLKSNLVNRAVKNTPFRVYGSKKQGYSIIMGNSVLTEPEPTVEDAIQKLSKNRWEIIANMIIIISDKLKEFV